MSSLVPGPIFPTSGLNRTSTPTPGGINTPRQIADTHKREPYNGHPWPRESPVARVYDIVNSTTSLILLNNKKSKKYSHLRGQSKLEADRIPMTEPDRHFSDIRHVNKELHAECVNSMTPRFTPSSPSGMEWINQMSRPSSNFSSGSSVNPRHHESCLGHSENPYFKIFGTSASPVPSPRKPKPPSRPPQSYQKLNLDDSGLTKGQRSYLWSISRVYSSENIRKQQQHRYFELLRSEVLRGGYSNSLLYQYAKYLDSPRKTQCGKDERLRRSKSAPPKQNTNKRIIAKMDKNTRESSNEQNPEKYKLKSTKEVTPIYGEKDKESNSSLSDSSFCLDQRDHPSKEGTIRPKSRIGRPKSMIRQTAESKIQVQETGEAGKTSSGQNTEQNLNKGHNERSARKTNRKSNQNGLAINSKEKLSKTYNKDEFQERNRPNSLRDSAIKESTNQKQPISTQDEDLNIPPSTPKSSPNTNKTTILTVSLKQNGSESTACVGSEEKKAKQSMPEEKSEDRMSPNQQTIPEENSSALSNNSSVEMTDPDFIEF